MVVGGSHDPSHSPGPKVSREHAAHSGKWPTRGQLVCFWSTVSTAGTAIVQAVLVVV